MAVEIGNLVVVIQADTGRFERGMSKATGFVDGLKGAAKVAAGVLMRDLARGLTQGAVSALKMGAQIETLRNSFESLSAAAGEYVPSLDELRAATQGMVSDTDLLLRANEALALGIPTENLDDLFDSAIRLGKAMGLDATQGIQALTIGVGRQSRLVLDNLGVIVKAEEAYAEYAKRIGKTSETLTENERRLGFQTIALEKITEKAAVLGDNISETEKHMSRWTATIKNTTTALGELLQPLGILAPALEVLGPTIGIMAATILPTLSAATLGYIGVAIAAVAAIALLIGAYQKYRRETDEVIKAQDRLEDAERSVAIASQNLINTEEELMNALAAQGAAYDAANDAIDRRVTATEALEDAENQLIAAEDALGVAQQDLSAFLSFLSGDVEEYVAVTADMVFASAAAQTMFAELSGELQGMQMEINAVSNAYGAMQGELSGMSDEEEALRLKLMKVNDAYEDGRLTKKQYERQSKRIRGELRNLNIAQAELRITMRDTQRTIDEQTSALEEAQGNLDDLADKSGDVITAQEDLDAKTEALESALEDEIKAIESVVEAQENLASAHSTVVTAQDALRDSNIELESSLRDIERATDDLAAAEAERESQRLERQRARGDAFEGPLDGETYPGAGPYDPVFFPAGAAGDTYQSTSTQRSDISINVSVGQMESSEDARRYGREFADEAVIELRRRGAL